MHGVIIIKMVLHGVMLFSITMAKMVQWYCIQLYHDAEWY